MIKDLLPLLCSVLIISQISAQEKKTIAEQLGFEKDAKLLIIHADDIGVSHSENQATIDGFEKGMINSGSIMVPCPWLPEIADYAIQHPEADLGLHLTLTAEWDLCKWPPVMPKAEVPGLVNDKGFLYNNCNDVTLNASVEEVEKELRAQIERAKAFGIKPTHFDTHMGCLLNPKYFGIYLKMGKEYGVPVMLSKEWFRQFPGFKEMLSGDELMLDKVIMANPEHYKTGMSDYYANVLKTLEPGANLIIIHAAYDDTEMQAVTVNHPDFGAAWRQADFDFFTSDTCKQLLEAHDIKLVTWREIGQLLQKD
jgi:hypothetical protein